MTAILKVKDGNGNVIPIQAIKGEKGDKGDKGDKGEQGIPGTVNGLPSGGYTGQTLVKNSDNNGDISWGGDLLNYDTTMVVKYASGKAGNSDYSLYYRIAPNKTTKFFGTAKTVIAENAGDVLSDVGSSELSDVRALGNAISNASSMTLTSFGGRSLDEILQKAENVIKDLDKLIDGGYLSKTCSILFGGLSFTSNPGDVRKQAVEYSKDTKRSTLAVYDEQRTIELQYNYNESDVLDYTKANYPVFGKWALLNYYDSRGEYYIPYSKSYAGRVLGINDSGKADYRTPSDLGLLTSSQGVENAGKVLTVGDDGIVVPTASSGGGSYTLPIASSTTLGGVKIGSGISVDETGVISASGGNSEEWKPLINHTVTEAESSENIIWWSTDGTDLQGNDVDAKEILIVIKPKLASATRMILQAYQYNSQNRNYLFFDNNRTVLSGNNIECAFHLRAYDIADDNNSSPTPKKVIEFITSKNVYTSYPSLSYGVSGIKINCSKMTGINMRISEDDGTNTLLTGSVIRGWWR